LHISIYYPAAILGIFNVVKIGWVIFLVGAAAGTGALSSPHG